MSLSEITASNSSGEQTLRRIRTAQQDAQTACVTKVVHLIREIASKEHSMSVQHLAEIIAGDLASISRVISVANTLGYNPEGVPVTTLTEAIQVIGFKSVSNLAVALLLFDNGVAGTNSIECREISALALVSGLVAQTILERNKSPDADNAFICAALRHYGKLAAATLLLDEYRRVRAQERELGTDAAYRAVLGLSPLELAERLLVEAQIPANVVATMRHLPDEKIGATDLSNADELTALAEFSGKLCELITAPGISASDFESQVKALADHYGRSFSLRANDIMTVVAEVDEKLSSFGSVYGSRVFSTALIRGIRALVANNNATPPVKEPPRPEPQATVSSEAERARLFTERSAKITDMAAQTPEKWESLLAMLAEAIRDGLVLDECLVFLKYSDDKFFSARIGNGKFFKQIQNRPLLDANQRSIFTIGLTRGDDLVIENPSDPRIAPFIPEWLLPAVLKSQLILLPVRTRSGTIAIVCGICKPSATLQFPESQKQQVKILRQQIARACEAANSPNNRPAGK